MPASAAATGSSSPAAPVARAELRRVSHDKTGGGGGGEGPCLAPASGPRAPSDPDYYRVLYDYLLANGFPNTTRVGSVERVPSGSLPPDAPVPGGPDEEVGIIKISSVQGFSASSLDEFGNGTVLVPRGIGKQIYGDTAGLMLGIHHFNNGDGSVVKEIAGIHERCPIRFVVDFFDSESSQATAVDLFTRQMLEHPDRPPSTVFGAWRSAVSVPLAIVSGVYAIPQISPLSTSTELDDVTQYRYFSRLIPSDAGTAKAMVDLFRSRRPDLRHMGVIYVNDAYGSAFHQAIQETALAIEPESDRISVKGSPFSYNDAIVMVEEIDLAVQTLANTGYKVFFGAFYEENYSIIMESAMKFGIAGPGYVWIISDGLSEGYLNGRSFLEGSPLAIASQGIGILKAEGGRASSHGDRGYDKFSKAWYGQTEEMESYYNCVGHPANNTMGDPSIYYQAEPGFFRDRRLNPTAGAVFTYDSVMAMGLAACELLDNGGDGDERSEPGGDGDGDSAPRSDQYFNGEQLFDSFVRQNFEGASGRVAVDPATTSRDPATAFFVLYNAVGTTRDGVTTFRVDTVSHTTEGDAPAPVPVPAAIAWVDLPGKSFVYSDGTTDFPPPLPEQGSFDANVLTPGMRGAGLAMAGLIFAASAFFALWTHCHRNVRVVKASQPMFLQMICVGTVIMGATIVTLSVDDSVASQAGCDTACMLSPWFFACGFTIAVSALFSKTWRINKIFHNPQYRRIKVTAKDVMAPFFVLITLNTIILSVWTAVSPLRWERTFRGGEDQFGRPLESYGSCRGETEEWAPYVASLLVVNLSVIVLANVQAYQARKITTEYSESRYIAIIMMSILQASFIGLPLVILVADNPAANFFVRSGIIFVFCISILLLMFVPKMYYLKEWKKAELTKKAVKEERERKRKLATERADNSGNGRDSGRPTSTQGLTLQGSTVQVPPDVGMRQISDVGMNDSASDCGGVVNSSTRDPSEVSNTCNKELRKRVSFHGDTKEGSISSLNESDALKMMIRDDDNAGQNEGKGPDVDEELAIIEKSTSNLGIPSKPTRAPTPLATLVRPPDIDSADGFLVESTHESDDLSRDSEFSSAASGIRIMNHPKMETKDMRLLKVEVDKMKLEKLELYDRIRALRTMLKARGVSDTELEPLTEMKESDRRPGLVANMSDSHKKLRDEVDAEAGVDSRASPKQMWLTASKRFIGNVKNLASSGGTQMLSQKLDGTDRKGIGTLEGAPKGNWDEGDHIPNNKMGRESESMKTYVAMFDGQNLVMRVDGVEEL